MPPSPNKLQQTLSLNSTRSSTPSSSYRRHASIALVSQPWSTRGRRKATRQSLGLPDGIDAIGTVMEAVSLSYASTPRCRSGDGPGPVTHSGVITFTPRNGELDVQALQCQTVFAGPRCPAADPNRLQRACFTASLESIHGTIPSPWPARPIRPESKRVQAESKRGSPDPRLESIRAGPESTPKTRSSAALP